MAPVLGNPTHRLRCTYTGPLGEHVMLFHGDPTATKAALVAGARLVVEAMTALQYDTTTWGTAEYAAPDSAIFNPEAWAPIVADTTANPVITSSVGAFVQFGGRGPDGARTKLYLFETYLTPRADMRYDVGENPEVADVVSALADLDNTISTKSGSAPIWKPYANFKFNDYLTHKARS